jgi:hypothetical protein
MKKVSLIIALAFLTASCEPEVIEPNQPNEPAQENCHCGTIVNYGNYTTTGYIVVRNNCSGNEIGYQTPTIITNSPVGQTWCDPNYNKW